MSKIIVNNNKFDEIVNVIVSLIKEKRDKNVLELINRYFNYRNEFDENIFQVRNQSQIIF